VLLPHLAFNAPILDHRHQKPVRLKLGALIHTDPPTRTPLAGDPRKASRNHFRSAAVVVSLLEPDKHVVTQPPTCGHLVTLRANRASGPFSLEDDAQRRRRAPHPDPDPASPSMRGAARLRRRILSTLPLSRHRLLSGVSGRFFRRAPAQASCCGPAMLSPMRGLPALKVRVAMGAALPGFLVPAIRAGALVSHCVVGI
jgi:hypothetical protein